VKKNIYILLFLLFSTEVYSQAFIDKGGYHAKLTALGRSVVALTGDPALLFYNPAAIGFTSSTIIFTNYTNLYPNVIDANMNMFATGGSFSFDNIGAFGVGITQFSPSFWSERMIVGTYATTILDENLSLGVNAKLLMWSAEAPQGDYAVPEPALSYNGFTFDAGASYRIPEIFEQNDLQLGLSILNLTQPSVAVNGSKDAVLPMELCGGAAYISRKYGYEILSGFNFRDGDIKITFGTEINALTTTIAGIDGSFFVRFGGGRVTQKDSQGEYNGGFGLKVDKFIFDYSYSYQAFISEVGGISSLSLSYEF